MRPPDRRPLAGRGKTVARTGAALALLVALGCLEPPEDDEVPLSSRLADPNVDPNDALHVEDDPELEGQLDAFADEVSYLRAFADGDPVWYWNVNGSNPSFIAPAFRVIGRDGVQIGRTIIDVIPGDAGYSPWWRFFDVRVTEAFNGERFWSREAIDAGIQLGLLEPPEETREVADCPVVRREVLVAVGGGSPPVAPTWIWYRDRRVHWVAFSDPISVDLGVRAMPMYPVYILQRINEGAPIYEFATGADLNGDEMLNASNNIFAGNLDSARYSPLWFASSVRVSADYLSIETSSQAASLRSEDDLLTSDDVVSIDSSPTTLVNCPIQRTPGEL